MSWNGTFEGSFKARASKPNHKDGGTYASQFKSSEEFGGIKLALHHISDWELLRGVWNRMVSDAHWGTICCWLYSVGFDTSNIYYETRQAQTPKLIVETLMLGGAIDESVADADEIHQRITWSTWNLVEGPKEDTRLDDLGNFHDCFSDVRQGISAEERCNLKLADHVYTAMSGLNLSSTVPKERALALSKAFLGVNRNAPMIKYQPGMWEKSGDAKKCWRKKLA